MCDFKVTTNLPAPNKAIYALYTPQGAENTFPLNLVITLSTLGMHDCDASVNNLPLVEFIPSVLVYSITLLVGVVGNSLVIFSISYYGRQKNVTNVFLLSLASADLLLVTVCVPIKVRYDFLHNTNSHGSIFSVYILFPKQATV